MIRQVIVYFLLLIILTSCSNDVHKQIYDHLENAFFEEQSFIENQKQLLSLEERDIEIYEEIIDLEDVKEQRMLELTNEALQIIKERTQYLEEEKLSLERSKKQFIQIEPLIKDINDEQAKEQLEKLYKTMLDRYDVYEEVYETYMNSLIITESLYEHIQNNASYPLIHETIQEVNDSYEQLFQKNDQFNRLTKQYNRIKQEYYHIVWEK